MEEADGLCQRLAIIDYGHVIALGTSVELKASVPGGYLLRVRFGSHSPELIERLKTLTGVREVRARLMTMAIVALIFTPIVVGHSFQKLRVLRRALASSCRT